jgi:hypothetical protein
VRIDSEESELTSLVSSAELLSFSGFFMPGLLEPGLLATVFFMPGLLATVFFMPGLLEPGLLATVFFMPGLLATVFFMPGLLVTGELEFSSKLLVASLVSDVCRYLAALTTAALAMAAFLQATQRASLRRSPAAMRVS